MTMEKTTGSLPERAGIVWAMPQAASTPSEKKYEMGLVALSTPTSVLYQTQKTISDVTFKEGELPERTVDGPIESLTYDKGTDGKMTYSTGAKTIPHWDFDLEKSLVNEAKWELAFSRTDTEQLGLRLGKEMTCYMAILDTYLVEKASQGVMLRWSSETTNSNSNLSPELDSAMYISTSLLSAAVAISSILF